MTKLFSLAILSAAILGCGKKTDPTAQCDTIYQKGDGTKSYTTDKQAFIDACMKVGAQTRECLLKGDLTAGDCAPGKGTAFREAMQLMQLGQGSGAAPAKKPAETANQTHKLTLTKAGGEAKKVPVQVALARAADGKGTGTLSMFLVGECPGMPADPCEAIHAVGNLDTEKLKPLCPSYRSVTIRFNHEDQMKMVNPADLKPGKYGRTSDPIRGSAIQVWGAGAPDDGSQFQVYGDNVLEITASDGKHFAGKLTAKSNEGEVTGTFDAKLCPTK